jgi:hypothetical protein
MGQHAFDIDNGFADFLQQLLACDMLEAPAEGITRQVIDQGEESLSEKQRYVFKT